jgi:hypothetical protein
MSFIFKKRLGVLWSSFSFKATSGALFTTKADKLRGCMLLPVLLDFSIDITDEIFWSFKGVTSIVLVGTRVKKVEDSIID